MPLPVPLTHCPRLEAGTSWVLNPDTRPDPALGLGTSVSPTIPRPSLEGGSARSSSAQGRGLGPGRWTPDSALRGGRKGGLERRPLHQP